MCIIPTTAKEGNLDSFLELLITELAQLEHKGMNVLCDDNQVRHFKARLILATGDSPGTASLAHHGGHQSKCGCRICIEQSVRVESAKSVERRKAGDAEGVRPGYGQYYPGDISLSPLREKVDYQQGNSVSEGYKRYIIML